MNTKLTRETITKDVWVTEPISPSAIHTARYTFRGIYIDEPDQLVCSIESRYEFLAQEKAIGRSADVITYMGMDLVVDPSLDKHSWCVRRSESNTRVVK